MAARNEVLSEYLRQQEPDGKQQLEPSWEDKALHSMSHSEIEEVADIKKSHQWLKKAGLKDKHRSTDHGRTGSENKMDRRRDLPHQTRSRVQAVQRHP